MNSIIVKEETPLVNNSGLDPNNAHYKTSLHNVTKTTVYSTINEDEAQALMNTTKSTTLAKPDSPFSKYIEEKSPEIKIGISQLITRLRAQVTTSSRQRELKPSATADIKKSPERARGNKVQRDVDAIINLHKKG